MIFQRLQARLRSLVASASSPKPSAAGAAEPWSIAARKQNRVLAMRLEPRGAGEVVDFLGCYGMLWPIDMEYDIYIYSIYIPTNDTYHIL
jgi:hypothetical protein